MIGLYIALFENKVILTITIILVCIMLFILLFSLFTFLLVFYSKSRKPTKENEYPLIKGKVYVPYHKLMIDFIKEVRKLNHFDVEIKSYDGLTLRGKYFKFYENAPIEIMLHGYRGESERDLSGGVFRAKKAFHNVLLVDNRACGRSDGHVITFGIRESMDLLKWIDFVIKEIDKDAKIILTGISMGASTVLMTSNKDLPSNVIGVLADCGYTTPKEIIKIVIKKLHLPPFLIYPFISIGARLFGGFSLNTTGAKGAVKEAKVPIIFFHGDNDNFVPSYMSEENYNNCISRKKLVLVKGAGHGLAYIIDEDNYIKEVIDFFNK